MRNFKKLLVALAATTMLSGCAVWNSPENLRMAYHAANVVDTAETLSRDPACMSEGNPFLGNDPPDSTVVGYALLQSLIYEGIYHAIEDTNDSNRKAFGRVFLVLKGVTIGWNASILAKGCN